MRLLELKGGKLTVSPELLTILPLKKIWDKNKDKSKAVQEISYVYFMMDKTNELNFWHIGDDDKRSEEVIKHIFGKTSKWKPDINVKAALEFWKENIFSYSEAFLADAMLGADKIREYLRKVNLNVVDDNGKPVNDINKLRDLIQKAPALLDSIAQLRKTIEKEQAEKQGKRGNKTVGLYERKGMKDI